MNRYRKIFKGLVNFEQEIKHVPRREWSNKQSLIINDTCSMNDV